MAQQPLMETTLQPTQSSCNLAAYSNRDDITTADSKDCVLCYNVGCSWFDCADLDTDTASDCYDPNDEYRLRTCTKYTFEECKSDYAGAVCTQGGTLLVVLGAILLIMTGFIRYNEYNYELSRKSAEAVQFLEDGSLVDDDRYFACLLPQQCIFRLKQHVFLRPGPKSRRASIVTTPVRGIATLPCSLRAAP